MLDWAARGPRHPVHQALAQPAGAGFGVGGDDDLVVGLLAQRVHRGRVGVGVHHLAIRLHTDLLELGEGHLEPVLGRVADGVLVDHVAGLGLVLGRDHVDADGSLVRALLDRVDQRLADHSLVGDYEDPLGLGVIHSGGGGAPPPPAGWATAVGSFSLNTACTAPGTPYS